MCRLMCVQAVLAESEARRSRHLQELEGIRASREQVEAQLAAAEAKLNATQAALAKVCPVMQPMVGTGGPACFVQPIKCMPINQISDCNPANKPSGGNIVCCHACCQTCSWH